MRGMEADTLRQENETLLKDRDFWRETATVLSDDNDTLHEFVQSIKGCLINLDKSTK